jgi:hypothetical protein
MVCIKYRPLVSPGGFALLLLLEKAQLSVKKPECVNANHISMVMLPVAGSTVGEILAQGPPWGLEGGDSLLKLSARYGRTAEQ